jgi:hypothetical protein
MRALAGFAVALLIAGGLFAQNRTGFVNTGGVVRTPGSVVFPGGTSAMPGVQRTAGSVVFPGGGPQVAIPSGITHIGPRSGFSGFGQGRPAGQGRGGSVVVGVPYPVYVGGGYYDGSYGAQPQQQQPNVVVVYPQQAPPVIINQFGPSDTSYPSTMAPTTSTYQSPVQSQTSEPPSPVESAHFLIAFKDHTIYSAVAYWVDGDTLHYFTNGNTHNQVSVSLIDRDLTARLNKDSGVEVKLPAAK